MYSQDITLRKKTWVRPAVVLVPQMRRRYLRTLLNIHTLNSGLPRLQFIFECLEASAIYLNPWF
jgi:hypothetical protein